jgi:hypothetical protein
MEILQFLGQIESGFKSRAGYNGACTVLNYSKSFLQEAIDGTNYFLMCKRFTFSAQSIKPETS